MHVQPASGARYLIFDQTLPLPHYFMCANSEGSCETAPMCRLAWAFAGCLCDKNHNLMSWLNLCWNSIDEWAVADSCIVNGNFLGNDLGQEVSFYVRDVRKLSSYTRDVRNTLCNTFMLLLDVHTPVWTLFKPNLWGLLNAKQLNSSLLLANLICFFVQCEQQRRRSACASVQSDQHLWCSLLR